MASDTTHQRDALYDLWHAYLLMRAWKRPEYARIGEAERAYFEQLILDGELFGYVEWRKRIAVQVGAPVVDEWLKPLWASRITADEGLDDETSARLGRIMEDIYPAIVRLDALADKPVGLRTEDDYFRMLDCTAGNNDAPCGWWTLKDARDYVARKLGHRSDAAAEQQLYRWHKNHPEMRHGEGRGSVWDPRMVKRGCENKL